jgi:hypothetical protein
MEKPISACACICYLTAQTSLATNIDDMYTEGRAGTSRS